MSSDGSRLSILLKKKRTTHLSDAEKAELKERLTNLQGNKENLNYIWDMFLITGMIYSLDKK